MLHTTLAARQTHAAYLAISTNEHPDVPIYAASVDSKLDDHAYIVPGLGDAGDGMYGTR